LSVSTRCCAAHLTCLGGLSVFVGYLYLPRPPCHQVTNPEEEEGIVFVYRGKDLGGSSW